MAKRSVRKMSGGEQYELIWLIIAIIVVAALVSTGTIKK
jgi:hypothetical protein